jgi:hypothetical protein
VVWSVDLSLINFQFSFALILTPRRLSSRYVIMIMAISGFWVLYVHNGNNSMHLLR